MVNATGHDIKFQDGFGRVHKMPQTDFIISAKPVITLIKEENGISFVRRTFVPREHSEDMINYIHKIHPHKKIIGSIIAAQAFPGKVFSLVPCRGFEKLAPSKRRARIDQLITFEEE